MSRSDTSYNGKGGGRRLSGEEEAILRATKEIVIKFIEMGRCSPASFEEVFSLVYRTIKKTLNNS